MMKRNSEVIIIRDMKADDLKEVTAILAEVKLCDKKGLQERVGFLLERDNAMCLCAKIDQRIAGCLLATFNGFHVFLSHIAVRPEFHHEGIGGKLHDELLKRAKQTKAKGIIADSWLTSAEFFYQQGYQMPGVVFLIKNLTD